MLPHADNSPSELSESPVGVLVPSFVPLELPLPPLLVGRRSSAVLRAAVPEAPVDEHRQPLFREGDVDLSSGKPFDLELDAEPPPEGV